MTWIASESTCDHSARLRLAIYNMSASPQEKGEVEAGAQSPEADVMDQDPEAIAHAMGYEFEVKEQDRWLPIANGACRPALALALPCPSLAPALRCCRSLAPAGIACAGYQAFMRLSGQIRCGRRLDQSRATLFSLYPSPPRARASHADLGHPAPVARIMKTALPENAKIAKEAKECMQECVSEFISFITSEGLPHPVTLKPPADWPSIGKVPAGETEDGQRGRHPLRHDVAWL